jgi:hypothetical protein
MLVPNLRPKAVAHGSRLLPGLIVRTRGRLVARALSLLCAQEEARPSGPTLPIPRSSPWPSSRSGPASEASATSGASLRHACAPTSRTPVHPGPVQPQGTSPREPELRALQRAFAGDLSASLRLSTGSWTPPSSRQWSESGRLAGGSLPVKPPSGGAPPRPKVSLRVLKEEYPFRALR